MTSSKKSMVAYAERLALSPDDRRELLRAAVAYDQRVAKLARAAAEGNADALKPRWAHQVQFWKELLAAASADADARLRELLLGGIQRLAAETLAAQPP